MLEGRTLEQIAKEIPCAVSTVSDDLKAIRADMIARNDNLADAILEEISLSIAGLKEGLRNLWAIIDDPNSETNERLRAIYLLSCLYKSQAEFLDSAHMIDQVAPKSQ